MEKKLTESLRQIVDSIKETTNVENVAEDDLKKTIMKCRLDDIKNVFHLCGGVLKDQIDQKKETIATVLLCNYQFLDSLSNQDNNHNMSDSVNRVNNNTVNAEAMNKSNPTETVESMVSVGNKENVAVV